MTTVLRIDADPVVRSIDVGRELVPSAGAFVLGLSRSWTPISEWMGALPGNGYFLHATAFCVARKEIRSQLACSKFQGHRYTLDQHEVEAIYPPEFRAEVEPRMNLVLTDNHAKHYVATREGRCFSLISSSNDGSAHSQMEWWLSADDPRLAAFLLDQIADEQPALTEAIRVPVHVSRLHMIAAHRAVTFPLPGLTVVKADSGLTSAAMLVRCLTAVGGGDLTLSSWSTSLAFVELLADLRKRGMLTGLDWLVDRSIKTRLSGSNGHSDVMGPLMRAFPGQVHLPARQRIHAKWAVIRHATGFVSILTSANWQESQRRAECYVVTPSPAVAHALLALQAEAKKD